MSDTKMTDDDTDTFIKSLLPILIAAHAISGHATDPIQSAQIDLHRITVEASEQGDCHKFVAMRRIFSACCRRGLDIIGEPQETA